MADAGAVAARLFIEVGARGLNETAAGLGRMGTAVDRSSQGIGGLVRAAGGIYAVKQAFDGTIGSAIAWESEFAGVEKTVEGTAGELGSLEAELLQMHRTMPIARADLAGIAEAAGALGVATDDIGEFTETVAMIGETTNVSSEQAASSLGKLSNVLGLTADDYDNFGAALVDLGNKGASTEAEIIGIAERAGAGASLIDIAADATLGWSSAVANLGIEAEAGGSSLQRFFLTATEQIAGSGPELETWADTAGMSVAKFKSLFEQDASAALSAFIAGLGEMDQATQLSVLGLLEFNDVRITRTLLGLAGDSDMLTDSLTVGADAWEENTALVEEYGKRADTTAARIEVLGNRFGDLGRRLGESAPTNFVVSGLEAWVDGVERGMTRVGVTFDEGAQELAAKLEDKGDFLRNNFLTEFVLGDEVINQITDNMLAWGTTLEETIAIMETGVSRHLAEASRGALAAWKQEDLGGQIVEDARSAAQRYVEDDPWKVIPETISEEMDEAREAAVDGMAATLDALRNTIRDDKSDYEDQWEAYLEGADSIFTADARSKFIAGQFSGDAFNEGLHSDDPARIQDTVDFVDAQLTEFDLLNPGVLEIGREVPANLQAGMEEIYPELAEWVKDKTGETLDNLSLEEAQQLGIDGIYLWFQGMRDAEQDNKFVAGAIASRAVNALSVDAWSGGNSLINSWINGMWAAWNNRRGSIDYFADQAGNVFGRSLPVDGPLKGGVASGGISIIESWFDGMLGEFGARMPMLEQAAGRIGEALAGPDLGTATGVAGAAGVVGGQTVQGDLVYRKGDVHVHVEGRPLDGSTDELVRVIQAADSVSDWTDV